MCVCVCVCVSVFFYEKFLNNFSYPLYICMHTCMHLNTLNLHKHENCELCRKSITEKIVGLGRMIAAFSIIFVYPIKVITRLSSSPDESEIRTYYWNLNNKIP